MAQPFRMPDSYYEPPNYPDGCEECIEGFIIDSNNCPWSHGNTWSTDDFDGCECERIPCPNCSKEQNDGPDPDWKHDRMDEDYAD